MAFENGHGKLGGRQAGTGNKCTASIKQAMSEAFEQLGGVAALVAWAQLNPDSFYKLWIRLLPQEMHGRGFVPPPPKATKVDSEREFARKVAFVLAAGVHDIENCELFKDMDMDNSEN